MGMRMIFLGGSGNDYYDDGYDQAINDVIKILKEEK